MTYNGWKNYETWNVALWVHNTEPYYHIATRIASRGGRWAEVAEALISDGHSYSGDGVAWMSPLVDVAELDSMVEEMAA